MSMHKLTAGDDYAYLTRQVAAGDAGLDAGASLTAYYEQTGNPPGRWYGSGLAGLGGEAISRITPGDVVTEQAMAAVFRDGHDPVTVSYTHLRAHETRHDLVCRLLLEKKKKQK